MLVRFVFFVSHWGTSLGYKSILYQRPPSGGALLLPFSSSDFSFSSFTLLIASFLPVRMWTWWIRTAWLLWCGRLIGHTGVYVYHLRDGTQYAHATTASWWTLNIFKPHMKKVMPGQNVKYWPLLNVQKCTKPKVQAGTSLCWLKPHTQPPHVYMSGHSSDRLPTQGNKSQ